MLRRTGDKSWPVDLLMACWPALVGLFGLLLACWTALVGLFGLLLACWPVARLLGSVCSRRSDSTKLTNLVLYIILIIGYAIPLSNCFVCPYWLSGRRTPLPVTDYLVVVYSGLTPGPAAYQLLL